MCEACFLGKHVRKSFKKEVTSRATKPLDIIHTNVYGPIDLLSFGKDKYFLLFIYDFSRKTWVYFLKQKSEAFIALRFDQGGQFTSKEFNDFCATYGICHPLIVSRLPQKNSMVEWKNRTILNMTKYMLKTGLKRFHVQFNCQIVL